MEEKIRHLIYQNAEKWFSDEMTMDDIEYHWNSILRDYKNKKLLRTYIQKNKRTREFNLKIYDENEELLSNKLNEESEIICIIELIGLKFSSHSFYLEAAVRQIMVFKKKEIFKKCLIKVGNKKKMVEDVVHNSNISIETTPEKEVKEENNSEENDMVNSEENDMVNSEENINKYTENKSEESTLEDIKNEIIKEVNFETNDKTHNNNVNMEEETTNGLDRDAGEKTFTNNSTQPEITNKQLDNDLDKNSENVLLNEESNHPINKSSQENEPDSTTPNDTSEFGDLEEFDVIIEENMKDANIKLRAPNDVYLDIYKAAKLKAKELKREAIKAHLEALKIKKTYMIDEIDSSSDEDSPGLLNESS